MRVAIFSGGSGNESLIRGLKSFNKNIKFDIIINALDDGKSTGICRKITNTLGVSDIRKNQYRFYKIDRDENNLNNKDKYIDFLFNDRVDIDINNFHKLSNRIVTGDNNFGDLFNEYFNCFIREVKNKNYNYSLKDFNIANIIYSMMFLERGYDGTIEFFKHYLGIKDDVYISCYDNCTLKAITYSGKILNSEGDIADFANNKDFIKSIFTVKYGTKEITIPSNINSKVIKILEEVDLIIISAGSFWSSIVPTFYSNFIRQAVEKSKAKKILITNTEENKDSFGITNVQMLDYISNYLDIKDFVVFCNADANDKLKIFSKKYKMKIKYLGNNNGKHDPILLTNNILNEVFGDILTYNNYIFDFDDTLWFRDEDILNISKENLYLYSLILNKKCSIFSGNSLSFIIKCFDMCNIINLKDNNNKIYSNYGFVHSDFKTVTNVIQNDIKNKSTIFHNVANFICNELCLEDKLIYKENSTDMFIHLAIKPLYDDLQKDKIIKKIKEFLKLEQIVNIEVIKVGASTIEIRPSFVRKHNMITKCYGEDLIHSLYFSDELDKENSDDFILKNKELVNCFNINNALLINTILKFILKHSGGNNNL